MTSPVIYSMLSISTQPNSKDITPNYLACPQKTPPPSVMVYIQNTAQTSVKFSQQNLARICTLCEEIRGNLM